MVHRGPAAGVGHTGLLSSCGSEVLLSSRAQYNKHFLGSEGEFLLQTQQLN